MLTTNGTIWNCGQIQGYIASGLNNYTGGYPGGLAFYTKPGDGTNGTGNTVVRMVLDSQGYIGVGTTAPQYTLDVNGNAKFNKLYVGTTTPSQYSTLEIDNATDATSFKIKSTGTGSGYMFISLNGLNPTISTTGILNFNGGLYVDSATAYVGTGTRAISPACPLHVYSTTKLAPKLYWVLPIVSDPVLCTPATTANRVPA